MGMWKKTDALKELEMLIHEISGLSEQRRFSAKHTLWLTKTLELLEEVFGCNSRYYINIAALKWTDPSGFVSQLYNFQKVKEEREHAAYLRDLETAKGLLLAALNRLKKMDISAVYQGKNTPPESSAILKVINIAEHKLRKVIRTKPTKEQEVQDAFEGLLIGADIPFSRESERIEYSSKTYVPDFTLKRIDFAIEIKLCSKDAREKEIIAEINDDILAYQTKYGNLLFVVYDLGFIRDIDRFAGSFEKNQNVVIKVVKQ